MVNFYLNLNTLAIASVDGAVHATFCILDKIFRTRKMRSKACTKQTNKKEVISRNILMDLAVLLYGGLTTRNSPSSYTLAATLAAIWADIFLILVNGG